MTVPPPTVAILAYPQTSASIVYGMYDLFSSVGREWGFIVDGNPGPSMFKPVVIAARSGVIATANGLRVEPHATFADLPKPDIVCVPEIALPPDAPLDGQFDEEIAWLVRCYEQGATIAAACSGALLLAEGGLLDGQEATTHWAYCDALRRRYPQVKVREQRALVISGEAERLVMAGGGTSWLDLALYLIARWCGVDTAMQVARISLIDWHEIGQQPFARLARSRQVEDAVIARCQTWIADHYRESAPVNAMVRLSGIAERSFKRRF
ncbi:MAG TPA: DJ-1/PfpI family protein, partial [Burkholderiales bacterium]|nr:DJ-1/PfpI family protein [Burkholderiales bacterium]